MTGDLTVQKAETVPIRENNDVVRVRQRVRAFAVELRFSLIDQTKIVTAASELGRNTLEHGKGGEVVVSLVQRGAQSGIQLCFRDAGPGISNIERALQDGYTSANGMGLGLSGSKRLMSEFEIVSEPGKGTTVTVTRWK